MSTKLTEHFSFEELTSTSNTELLESNREEAKAFISQLTEIATALEAIRSFYDKPVNVHSGFRGGTLNTAVGGSKTSDHSLGLAADIDVVGVSINQLFEDIPGILEKAGIQFGQLIKEKRKGSVDYTWVHISVNVAKHLAQKLIFDGTSYTSVA